tara:strand:+ start:1800 stop:2249 length:450 start_codon:yes stop_codon:yes gene_type:complete
MSQTNLSWHIRISCFYKQYPRRSWLAVVAFIAAFSLGMLQKYLYAALMVNVAIQCFIAHKNQEKRHLPVFVPDILAELKLQQDMLHVKHRQLPVSKIRKVALNQIDDKEALIDFPFNVYQKLAMRFPASQLPALQAWLKQYLPMAQIID